MRTGSNIAFLSLVFLVSALWICGGLWAQQPSDRGETIVLGLLVEDSLLVEGRYGAEYAIEEINRQGGLHEKSIVLSVRSMEGPWGVGSTQAVDLVFEQKAKALVGLLDGRNSHLVEQVAAKTDVPFVSAWAADPTLSKAYVPQFFNCVPNSEEQGVAILNALSQNRKSERWILVSDEDYDSQMAVKSLKILENFDKNPAAVHFKCNSQKDFEVLIRTIRDTGSKALVIYCNPELSVELISFLRYRAIGLPVYAGLSILHERTYTRLLKDHFENLYFTGSGTWMTDRNSGFAKEFHEEYGRYPGAMAAYAYDAIHILAEALIKSETDPKVLKQSLSKTSFEGKTGLIEFDRFGNRKSTQSSGEELFGILSLSKP
jgi:branched-chain amino acid transport system substrate-binding protein